jgi:hypothetical protein
MEYDSSLRDRLGIAIFDAILEVSTPPNGSQPVLSTGAAFDALLMVAATTIARSSGCGTPRSRGDPLGSHSCQVSHSATPKAPPQTMEHHASSRVRASRDQGATLLPPLACHAAILPVIHPIPVI